VFEEAKKLLEDPGEYGRMSNAVNPYGDGNAAVRTVDAILHYCGIRSSRPRDFLSKVMAHE
jgi:UDP-N-acetylglucosamine 2-epimerase (non-hydrolysing)